MWNRCVFALEYVLEKVSNYMTAISPLRYFNPYTRKFMMQCVELLNKSLCTTAMIAAPFSHTEDYFLTIVILPLMPHISIAQVQDII